MTKEKILVLCVDRDGDIKSKVGDSGPIVGREHVLDIATNLALNDPTESDANALFETIRIGDQLKGEDKDVEVAALTGSVNVGVESDSIISRQVDEVLESIKPDGVIVVTDGAEDEYVLPIIQSRVNIISVKRVIVKQSEHLESTYYAFQSFLKYVINDPNLSRLIIGLPGVALILYFLLGGRGWRLILGVVGTYLIIKGFDLEDQIHRFYEEFKSSFTTGRVSFFFYAVAVIIAAVGVLAGINEINSTGIAFGNMMKSVPLFISKSIELLAFAAGVALAGRAIDSFLEGQRVAHYLFIGILIFGVYLMGIALSRFILGQMDQMEFATKITQVLILSIVTFLSIRSLKKMGTPEGD